MQIAIPLYDRFTALDAVGPYEVLSRIPESKLTFVGYEVGPVRTDNERLAMHADAVFEDIPEPDVIVVPGGWGTRALLDDERILSWIRHAHEHSQWTTSVCTGSLLLGAAGVLDGLEATSHWLELDALAEYGASPTERRVVEQGKVITAAGVSSGIDMGLTLLAKIAGDDFAKTIQLLIEYDPEPPFDAGSPDKADPEIVANLRRLAAGQAATSQTQLGQLGRRLHGVRLRVLRVLALARVLFGRRLLAGR